MAKLPEFFGIDIGRSSIKLAELEKYNDHKAKLLKIEALSTIPGMLENESESGMDALSQEISKLYKSSSIKTKNCVLAVSERAVFSRLVTLPKIKEEEVTEAIHWSIKPLIPVPIDTVNVSFLKINEKKSSDKILEDWYVVAASKKLIERYRRIIDKANLNLLAIETESLALTRVSTFNNPDVLDKVIIDIGGESTDVILARNGVVVFSQIINTGSNAITKVISADFGIDFTQAEKYKKAYGIDPVAGEGKIAKSIEPILEIIVSEIIRTITYFKEKIGGTNISAVYITGGGSELPKLPEFLTSKLQINTMYLDLFHNISLESNVKKQFEVLSPGAFSVAIGLGLKSN